MTERTKEDVERVFRRIANEKLCPRCGYWKTEREWNPITGGCNSCTRVSSLVPEIIWKEIFEATTKASDDQVWRKEIKTLVRKRLSRSSRK